MSPRSVNGLPFQGKRCVGETPHHLTDVWTEVKSGEFMTFRAFLAFRRQGALLRRLAAVSACPAFAPNFLRESASEGLFTGYKALNGEQVYG